MAQAKSPTQQGLRQYATLRYGQQARPEGMRDARQYLLDESGDMGNVVLPWWIYLQNVRVRESGYAKRGGAQAVVASGIEGGAEAVQVTGLYDFQTETAHRLYFSSSHCPNVVGAGETLMFFDQELESRLQRVMHYPGSSYTMRTASYDGELYIATPLGSTASELRRVRKTLTVETPAQYASAVLPTQDPTEVVGQFPGWAITYMRECFGLLFLAMQPTGVPFPHTGACQIVAYDGRTFRVEQSGTNDEQFLIPFRDTLVVGHNPTGLRTRDAAGTWTTSATTFLPGYAAEYRDNLYITAVAAGPGAGNLWKWDGASATLVRTIPSVGGSGVVMRHLASFDGYLYYAHLINVNDPGHPLHLRLGRMDSAGAFTDTHWDFTTSQSLDVDMVHGPLLLPYRGSLAALLTGFDTVVPDTSVSYVALSTAAGTAAPWQLFPLTTAPTGVGNMQPSFATVL